MILAATFEMSWNKKPRVQQMDTPVSLEMKVLVDRRGRNRSVRDKRGVRRMARFRDSRKVIRR